MNLAARVLFLLSLSVLTCLTLPPNAAAQSSGSRGGVLSANGNASEFPTLDREIAERYIMIEGSADVRVRPTDIRVVLAVTNEAETATQCQEGVQSVIGSLPMKPEISVVAKVRIYFESPAAMKREGERERGRGGRGERVRVES